MSACVATGWFARSKASGPAACVPEGLRIYAFGDVHGRFDLLEALYAEVRLDVARRPAARTAEIFLGDYIDRGRQSREVLEWLISASPATDERTCLLGNHEDMLLRVVDDPEATPTWLQNGGLATLISYGAVSPNDLSRLTLAEARTAFLAAFPPKHRAFVERLPRLATAGGYLFVHAGLRPGRAVEDQDPDDLVWIREPFLSSDADFGMRIVHGHTPVATPEIRPNRINVDTGAVFTGRLTCLVLEAEGWRFLQTAPD